MATNDNLREVERMREMLYGKAKPEPTVAAKPIATLDRKSGQVDVTDEIVGIFTKPVVERAVKDLQPALVTVIEQTTTDLAKETGKELQDGLDKALAEQKKSAAETLTTLQTDINKQVADLGQLAHQVRPIEVRTERNTVQLKGVNHAKFENLLKIVGARLPVFMVGPAGTGKTAGAEKVAQALGLDFWAMSVGSQTSKADIFGYKDAQGNYHGTAFRQAYENGGIFLLDEADAGNANVLVGLNAALSNGYVFFPDKQIKMHDNFRMIATANTFGNGASRQYVGRNQLDAATLDRFVVLTWDIDSQIEEALATGSFGKRWLKVVRAVRNQAIDELELRAVVSPRATLRGSVLLDSGLDFTDVLEVALIANMPEAERAILRTTAQAAWDLTSEAAPKRKYTKKAPEVTLDLDALKNVYDGDDDGVDGF